MRCERFWTCTVLLIALGCSRETPQPEPTTSTPGTAATPTQSAPPPTTPPPPVVTTGSYEEAMLWFGAAPAFAFELREGKVQAKGTLERRTVGDQTVQFRAGDVEWRATSGPRGVIWEKRNGQRWAAATAPDFGNRVYQRVTLALDPQKNEGSAQLVGKEGGSNHYRFTNTNTGDVHDVWVSATGGHIERMTIGAGVELTIAVSEEL